VAGVGDMNGDGIPDFAVGAPGEFSVGFGAARGFVRVYSGADASILHHIDGDRELSLFGFGVSGTGDINADGVPDLLVGAPYDPSPSIAKGSVAAYSGRTGAMLWRVYAVLNGAVIGSDFGFDIVGLRRRLRAPDPRSCARLLWFPRRRCPDLHGRDELDGRGGRDPHARSDQRR
jgi:hypothetical protein